MEGRIETQEDIRDRLKELKAAGKLQGLEMEANKVEGLLLSPDNLPLAIEGLEELERKILHRENAHLEELRPYLHKMDIWTKQGFDTSGLANVLGQDHKDMDNVERLFWRFEKMVERVVNMEKDLFQISIPEFEVEIESLRDVMTDHTRFGEVARRYHHLVETINTFKKEGKRRRELQETVDRYREMGYKVEQMVPTTEGPVKDLEVAVSELEDAVIILQDLEESVNSMDPTGREEQIGYIKRLLYEPGRLADAMDEVESLERSI